MALQFRTTTVNIDKGDPVLNVRVPFNNNLREASATVQYFKAQHENPVNFYIRTMEVGVRNVRIENQDVVFDVVMIMAQADEVWQADGYVIVLVIADVQS